MMPADTEVGHAGGGRGAGAVGRAVGPGRAAHPEGRAPPAGRAAAGRRPGLLRRHRVRAPVGLPVAGPAAAPAERPDLLAAAPRLVPGRRLGGGLGRGGRRARRRGRAGPGRAIPRLHPRGGAKGGDEVGRARCGKGMKVSMAVDRTGVPVGVLTAAANVADVGLAADTLGSIPEGVEPPAGTPVIADKGYDSDPLRAELAAEGYRLI